MCSPEGSELAKACSHERSRSGTFWIARSAFSFSLSEDLPPCAVWSVGVVCAAGLESGTAAADETFELFIPDKLKPLEVWISTCVT